MKKFLIFLFSLLVAAPAFAVFNEENLTKTLSVLREELKQEVDKRPSSKGRLENKDMSQHLQLVQIMKKCNELSLMLYSQKQDYTFDLTYALKEVTREYEDFNRSRLPFDEITARLDIEIERYSRLVESLRRIPPQLREVEDLPDSLAYHNDSVSFSVPDREFIRQFRRDSLNARGHMATFFLDEKGQEDRDSCLFYAMTLLKMYSAAKDHIIEDSEHYEDADVRLKESYDYAQKRYKDIQKRIFMGGQDNYLFVLKTFPSYLHHAVEDAAAKYGRKVAVGGDITKSEWRGPMVLRFLGLMLLLLVIATALSRLVVWLFLRCKVERTVTLFCGIVVFALTNGILYLVTPNHFFQLATGLLVVLSWLLAAIVASLMARNGKQAGAGLRLFLPIIIIGIIVIAFRIVFIPNRVMTILFSPLLLVFTVWQIVICRKHGDSASQADRIIAWVSAVILGISSVMSWLGFLLLGIQVLTWWLFQIAAIETVMVLHLLLERYETKHIDALKKQYSSKVAHLGQIHHKGEYIRVTWLYDFLSMTAVPVIALVSIPLTIFLALTVFDLTDVYDQLMYTTFFDLTAADGKEMLKISLYMIILATSLFFLFKYVSYVAKSLYRNLKLKKIQKESGSSYIHTNAVNLTLADNVISILVWGTYAIITILLLRIPTGAVSVVAAGLATGLGLAMKDILNNFIYGIQLMSGRLRVGDWMECDGVRGKVTAISYQSTQIETTDGAVMSFLNTALFNKNFKNLTRNNDYEFVKIVVGVAYGTDVEKVRMLLLDALKQLQTKDSFNREIVDIQRGVSVVFDEFGDNSVNVAVKQFVLVAEKAGYISRAKEVIYNALNENNISIPFPQRDIHVITA